MGVDPSTELSARSTVSSLEFLDGKDQAALDRATALHSFCRSSGVANVLAAACMTGGG